MEIGSTWSNQTGTNVVCWDTASGGTIQVRDNNPGTGQCSILVDGTVYVNEGRNAVISTADIGNQSVKYATSAGSANSVAWGNVTGKPATYAPSSHTHTLDQVTNLQSTLNGKAAKSHTHDISDVSNLQSTINTINDNISSKYSSSGGTLNGDLAFPDIGDTGESKGITWAGSTDSAKIYYKTTAEDAGHLVLQAGDDSDARIDFEWYLTDGDSKVTTKSYITSDGVYHGKATNAAKFDGHSSSEYYLKTQTISLGDATDLPSSYTGGNIFKNP